MFWDVTLRNHYENRQQQNICCCQHERMAVMRLCKFGGIIALTVIILSGCNNRKIYDEAETVVQETEKEDFFPSSYTGGTEKVKFDCELEIPDDFDSFHFYLPSVKGLQCIDQNEAYKIGVGEHEIKDQIVYPKDSDSITDQYYYFLDDDTVVGIDSGFYLWNDAASCYVRTEPLNASDASKEQFDFASADEYIEQIKNKLECMSYPVDELEFSWFSVNENEYRELEEKYIANGYIEPDKKKNEWTEEDNVYEIYAWQKYGGLQVFQQYMTVHMKSAFESYQKAPVSAYCSEKGILSLTAVAPYAFEATGEKAVFLKFPEIAELAAKKYDNLLDETTYTVERAKLAVRVYYDEKQEYAAEPIWYFEVKDGYGNETVLIMNAVTGKEIYLDS